MTTFEIKTTVSTQDVLNMFEKEGRGYNFTYDGLEEILNNIESCNAGDVIDLDVIAICCEYTECTPEQFINDYGLDIEDFLDSNDELDGSLVADYVANESWGAFLSNGNIVYLDY